MAFWDCGWLVVDALGEGKTPSLPGQSLGGMSLGVQVCGGIVFSVRGDFARDLVGKIALYLDGVATGNAADIAGFVLGA